MHSKLANGDVSYVAFYFSGEPGRSSSQESVGPEANRGLDVLSHRPCT